MAGLANIAFGYRGIAGSPAGLPALFSKVSSENLVTSELASTPSVGAAPAGGNRWQLAVRVVLSEDGYIDIGGADGAAPTAAAGDMRLTAAVEYFFAVPPNAKIAIRDVA